MSGKCPSIDTLNIAEAFSLAITIEEEGAQFYDTMIGHSDKEEAKKELQYLKEDELAHKVYFEKLLKESGSEFTKDESSDLHCWVDDEIIQPLKTAVDKHLPESNHEALKVGIRMVENVVDMLMQLKKAAEDKEAKKAMKKILKEKRLHRKKLEVVEKYMDYPL